MGLVDIGKSVLVSCMDVKAGENVLILTDDASNIPNIMFNDPTLIEHSAKIIESFAELMTDKGSKKITINNGDIDPVPNDFQKYFDEEDFNRMYRTMLKILQKRSIYRYKFDKDTFIGDMAAELNRLLAKKTDKVQFSVTNANVAFNDAKRMQMADAQTTIEENDSADIQYEERSVFEIANYIMHHTMLPRLAIIKIINKLNNVSRNRINNQDYLEDTVKLIEKKLIEYKSKEFVTAEIIAGISAGEKEIFEVDKIINEADIKYLFTPNPSRRRAINQKYKFDSEGELKFAKALDADSNVLMWTKLKKGGFIIETPAGNYSPDWAIVYQNNDESFCMYFIAETKWDKVWGQLMSDEQIKINCATKHFEAVNNEFSDIIKYAWVNGYKDKSMDNSFPEIFIDENYANTIALERMV